MFDAPDECGKEALRLRDALHKHCRTIHRKCPAQPVNDSVEQVLGANLGTQRPSEIHKRVAHAVSLTVENLVQPDSEIGL